MECEPAWMKGDTYICKKTIEGETKNLASDFAKAVGLPVHKQPWHQRAQVCQRNAPCPCGSGKKFKVCHGGSR